ncbi:hypothetical protein DAQ1742_01344 [Dickeya aquatica]|uniref:Uncharacterized protein n=1 Tax=Dickeya aquatica TaxID=1401087 RepID=A0A375A8T1_9GAMM|nr:hypothetical protein DAQ1742_01344 [Dickeya aquatica]
MTLLAVLAWFRPGYDGPTLTVMRVLPEYRFAYCPHILCLAKQTMLGRAQRTPGMSAVAGFCFIGLCFINRCSRASKARHASRAGNLGIFPLSCRAKFIWHDVNHKCHPPSALRWCGMTFF